MEQFKSVEDIRQQLSEKLENARRNSLPYEEVTQIIEKMIKVQNGDGSKEELEELNSKLSESSVTVNTISEFKLLLEQTDLDPEVALDALAHENAHANVATSLGSNDVTYTLLVARGKRNWIYDLWASYDTPEGLSEREKIVNHIKIHGAPEEYGTTPSKNDKRTIKDLEKKLRKIDGGKE